MTPAPALPGMETSAEERAEWRKTYSLRTFRDEDLGRLVRDFDRAFAAGREAERAEIVAWLRSEAKGYRNLRPQAHGSREASLIEEIIEVVERAAHIPASNMVGQP